MANATGIYVKDWRDGNTYYDWAAPSAGSWVALAGYGYGGQNWVTAIKFRVTSPASAVSFSWVRGDIEGGSRDIRYKITEGEDNSYINATAATAGDGMITATSGAYNRTTLNVTKDLKANTDYVLYLWTDRNTSYQNYTTLRIWNSTEYPFRVTYTEASSYSLSLSVGSNVSGTVSINSSPYGRSGNISNGAKIYANEVLKLTYSVSTGYAIDTHTINGTSVSSGATHTVVANVAIILSAKASLSVISTGNGTFGTSQTITVTRYNSSYTHTIVASCAGASQNIATKSSSLSITWTPQNSFMNGLPNATSAPCTLTCTTYNGATAIGSNTITVTLSVPAGIKPAPSLSVSDAMGHYATYGGYVQGFSKAAVTVTDGNVYSATTASRSTSANGVTYSAASFTTGALKTSGSNTISTSVKDSRGRTGTASVSITVLAYSSPAISSFAVHRCDQDGTANDDGNYFKVSYAAAVTSLNSHNSKTLKFRYKIVGTSTWTDVSIPMSTYTQSGDSSTVDITTGVANGSSYDVEIILKDDFSTISRATTLSTVQAILDFNEFGDGIGIGKSSSIRKTIDIGTWSAIGRVYGLGQARSAIPANADLNTYTEMGVYGITDAAASTLSNKPTSVGGRLIVSQSIGGTSGPGETYQYLLQEYIDRYGDEYRRYGLSNNSTTVSWFAWQGVATKSALGLGGLLSESKSVANNSTMSFTLANNEKGAVICSGVQSAAKEFIIFNSTSTGGISAIKLGSASGISVSTSTHTLTISNTSGAYAYGLKLSFIA